MPVWGEGERPAWLAPEDQQPKKREWSPVRDRMEAELELRARLEEQRRLRKKQRYQWVTAPFTWTFSLLSAVVSVSREEGGAAEAPAPAPPAASSSAMLDTLPAPRVAGEPPPALPAEDQPPAVWEAHPEAEWKAPPAEAEPEAPPAVEEPTVEHHELDWTALPPAPPAPPPPPPVYRAPVAPDKDWRPAAGPTPAWEIVPEAELVTPPTPSGAGEADELARVILSTCVRTSGAEVGILTLLQDDVLVVRASSGMDVEIAGRLALDTLSDICLDVIASGQSFTAATNQPAPDPDRPSAILSVPVLLSGTGVGAVLLLAYAHGRTFSPDQERLVRALAEVAGPELSAAGAFRMAFDRPGVLWSRLDAPLAPAPAPAPSAAPPPPVPSEWHPAPAAPEPAPAGEPPAEATAGPEAPEAEPEPAPPEYPTEPVSLVPPTHRTMTLDPEMVKRLIAEAKAAREVEEAAVAAETAAEAQAEPPTAEMSRPAVPAAEPATEEMPAPVAAAPPPESAPEPARARPKPRDHHQVGWRARVQSRMTRVRKQRQEEEARERAEILAAIRNLSWDGYQALVADIFRRKAFEVLPPPAEGSDLDVIDLVVDRDGQRMLVNCQLRGEMDIPIEAVTEMTTVVYNYSVAGAYLIADGSFAPEASGAAATGGIVLIDGNALIDLTIETTLKDERKSSFTGRIAKRFVRAK